MSKSPLFIVVFIAATFIVNSCRVLAEVKPDWSHVAIEAMMQFHGLDRQAAVDRLEAEAEAEAEAADIYRRIRDIEPAGYGGSWFDPRIASLQVALSSNRQKDLVEAFGGVVRPVAWSLAELDVVKD